MSEETEVVEEVEQTDVETPEEKQVEDEKTFTQSELEAIVAQRVAREQKAKEKAVEEAKKLAKMNADEKEKYEREQLEKELAEYKRKDAFYGLSQEASKMLAEQNIQADEEVLGLVVKDDAEGTQKAVNAFTELINRKVEEGVQKALSGSAPRLKATNKPTITSDKFKGMTYLEKVELRKDKPELYEKLIKGE